MLIPSSEDEYTRSSFVAISPTPEYIENTLWRVRIDDGSQEERVVAASSVRFPLSLAAAYGSSAPPITVGSLVHALRGIWQPCTLVGSISDPLIRFTPPGAGAGAAPIEVRVATGTLILDDPASAAAGDAGDAASNGQRPVPAPGSFAIYVSSNANGSLPLEVEVLRPGDADGTLVVRSSEHAEQSVLTEQLRVRHALSYRVLVSSGGFQRSTLEAVSPDGMLCVAFAGGGRRWVSAAEVAVVARGSAHGTGAGAGGTGVGAGEEAAGLLVAVLPSHEASEGGDDDHASIEDSAESGGARPNWLPAAITLPGGSNSGGPGVGPDGLARRQARQRKEVRGGKAAMAAMAESGVEEAGEGEGAVGDWTLSDGRLVPPLLSKAPGTLDSQPSHLNVCLLWLA